MDQRQLTARIFDIQGMSTHDGPGGRTLVFFKGCPLRCYWCCNPEGLHRYNEVMYRASNCVRCGRCAKSCEKRAISLESIEEGILIDRDLCKDCNLFECVNACYHEGLKLAARDMTVDQVMRRLNSDSRFWGSNGGVTLGGGECMAQHEFVLQLLKACKQNYYHTAIETSGMASEESYLSVLPYLDWIFMDIKHMDSNRHKLATGCDNSLILRNMRTIAENRRKNTQMIVRIPCIIGFNDTCENITATANYVKSLGLSEVNILPFHRLGASKYKQLHKSYSCEEMKPPLDEDMERIRGYVEDCGIACYVGSNTPF